MKKFIYILTIVGALIVCLTACEKEETPITPSIKLSATSANTVIADNGTSATTSIEAVGGTIEVNVESNVEWAAEPVDANWVAVTTTKNKLSIIVPDNKMAQARTAKINLIDAGAQSVLASVSLSQDALTFAPSELAIELKDEDEEIFFSGDGGTYTVNVLTTKNWSAETEEHWLDIIEDRENNTFTIVADKNATFSDYEGTVLVRAGNNENEEVSLAIKVTQFCTSNAMMLTVKVDETTENTIILPIHNQDNDLRNAYINCLVDWGDGTIQHVVSVRPRHTYEVAGTYSVRIYGLVESLASNIDELGLNENLRNCFISIDNWGNLGLRSLKNAFNRYNKLEYIAPPQKESFSKLTSVYNGFRQCVSLTEIPAGLFANAPNLTEAYAVFEGSSGLTAVPDSLFAGCSKITRVTRGFWSCSGLQSVGKDVFAGCTSITNIGQLFYSCTELKTIPAELFDDCTKIDTFSYAFRYCTSLESESPYTLVNGEKVHLYEREKYPNLFVKPRTFTRCFENCTKMVDFSIISENYPAWGNG